MKAKKTPALATASRLIAIVSVATAMSGVLLSAGGASSVSSSSVAGGVAHSARTSIVAPAMRCGSDCPWDGTNS